MPSPIGNTERVLPGITKGAAGLDDAASAESAADVPEAEPSAAALVGVPEPAAAAAAATGEDVAADAEDAC